MSYDLTKIPIQALLQPISEATAAIVRLDERLKQSLLGPGCLERLHFRDACASLWVDGQLVHLEDLVLHDSARDIRSPTHELTIAHAVLRARRKILRHPPDWALRPEGFLALRGAEDFRENEEGRLVNEVIMPSKPQIETESNEVDPLAQELAVLDAVLERSTAVLAGENLPKREPQKKRAEIVYDPDWNQEDRMAEWREVLRKTENLPPVLRAVLLLDAWNFLDVLERMPWLGRLLAASSLSEAGLTTSTHLATANLGLKLIGRDKRTSKNLDTRLTALLSALTAAAEFGLKEHDKLVLARQTLDHRLKGRRKSSKLPALVDLVLARPMVSAGTIAKEIGITPQAALRLVEELNLRELTGRGRFRVWGVM
ncbi:RHE_PE00001 family protein [uncultured Roseibium sp.]|uniref:RHE_PE00001 family protein n=1 Tax=uncultured Roseibium sp. TaxID=1936171 RepID=UPI00262EB329|nr:RHE_PE00001 family protein [uncultured Roseibium sp.]